MLRVAFAVMRTVVTPGLDPAQVVEVFRAALAVGIRELLAEPGGPQRFAVVVRYTFFRVQGLDRAALHEAVAVAAGERAGEVVMSTAEELIAEGIEKGIEKGARAVVRRQLERKFGALSEAHRLRLEAASEAQLDAWVDEAPFAARVEDVLGPG